MPKFKIELACYVKAQTEVVVDAVSELHARAIAMLAIHALNGNSPEDVPEEIGTNMPKEREWGIDLTDNKNWEVEQVTASA